LAEFRKGMDVTQVKLANKSGINQAEISRIENDPETVQLRTMERYVRSLGGSSRSSRSFRTARPHRSRCAAASRSSRR